jgi:enoyl-CoA hydratase/carnithine racemase
MRDDPCLVSVMRCIQAEGRLLARSWRRGYDAKSRLTPFQESHVIDRPAGVGKEVLFEIEDQHIALVTLNRPQKRNAINGAVANALDYIVKSVEADDNIRVAILTSSSEGTFCAGADLAEVAAGKGAELRTPDGGFGGFTDAKRAKPWIAAVRGPALAGGCELALACDMIVASADARFGLPEVKRGLFAAGGGAHRLPLAIPRKVAYELIATGESLPAERAYTFGLVNRLTSSAEVLHVARQLAEEIAANAPLSVRESLRIARLAHDLPDAELRALSRKVSELVLSSEDSKEGPRAFLEKRPPQWRGR